MACHGASPTQSIALWRAYQEVCVYCNKPIDSLAQLEIDHIIPTTLRDTPDELHRVLNRLGVPDLELDSYQNWLPVHGRPCNRQKSGQLLPDTTLLNYLSVARNHENRARDEEKKIRRQALNKSALAPLVHLLETGELSKKEAKAFIDAAVPQTVERRKSDPLVLSFGINLGKLESSGELPEGARAEPPKLYDWLETELERAFHNTEALFTRATKTESDRNGETISVRYAFWLLDIDLLPAPLPCGWELLEVAPFSEVYPGQDSEDLLARGLLAKSHDLIFDRGSDDPLPYKRCPICGSADLSRTTTAVRGEEILTIRCRSCSWAERW